MHQRAAAPVERNRPSRWRVYSQDTMPQVSAYQNGVRSMPSLRAQRAAPRGSRVAAALLLAGGLFGCAPDSTDSGVDTMTESAGESVKRDFTIAGPEVVRDEVVLYGDSETALVQPVGDGENAFDAMVNQFEEKYPGLIRFGGKSTDGSGTRWLLIPEAPNSEQVRILEGYGLPLRVQYGTAPTHASMAKFAQAFRLASRDSGSVEFQGYGFNDQHSGVEILYSAPANLSVSEIEEKARSLVARALGQEASEPDFDIDFVEVSGPMLAEVG